MWLRTSFLGSRDFNSNECRQEGDDLGSRLLGMPVGLVNKSLEVMDGLKILSLNRQLPRGAGAYVLNASTWLLVLARCVLLSFDSRATCSLKSKAVTPAMNQRQCASCLTSSATASLEKAWSIITGNLLSLNELQFVIYKGSGAFHSHHICHEPLCQVEGQQRRVCSPVKPVSLLQVPKKRMEWPKALGNS